MKKIIFLEGLPNVGKTYILNYIRKMSMENVFVVDEIINPDIENPFIDEEKMFLKNDEMKISKYNDGIIIIDRGPISTLVYNQLLHIINNKYNCSSIEEWFLKFVSLYESESTYNYYLYNPDNYIPSLNDSNNPYGSVENLKMMDSLTKYNLKKYAKNYKFIMYNKMNIEEVINEIIN